MLRFLAEMVFWETGWIASLYSKFHQNLMKDYLDAFGLRPLGLLDVFP